LKDWHAQRREIGEHYDSRFRSLGITLHDPSLYHHYVIKVPEHNKLAALLTRKKIGLKIHGHVPLNKIAGPWQHNVSYDQAEKLCNSILSLPCFPGLRSDEIGRTGDIAKVHFDSFQKTKP